MGSDLSKHEETKGHAGIQLGMGLMMGGLMNSKDEARNFINGFN